jgi:hypothetical protein
MAGGCGWLVGSGHGSSMVQSSRMIHSNNISDTELFMDCRGWRGILDHLLCVVSRQLG